MSISYLFAVCLLATPNVKSQDSACYSDFRFGNVFAKEGYAECPTGQQFLYLKGLELKGTSDDLKNVEMAKCCQPPNLHQNWPYTCHSADWSLSFSR